MEKQLFLSLLEEVLKEKIALYKNRMVMNILCLY